MSIKSIFQNIADAIKTKDTSIDTLTPLQMPSAILNIPTGDAVIIPRSTWDNLTDEEKKSHGYVGILDNDTGYLRGVLVYGAAYGIHWDNIKKIVIGGKARSSSSSYVQLGDIRFKDSNNNYLSSQYNNIASYSTKYGSFMDNWTRALFDNDANTKCITSGGYIFEWTSTFTNAIDLTDYSTLELWTANDSSDRDPYTDVYIIFEDTSGFSVTLNIGNTNMPTNRTVLGYSNNDYKNEVIV